jgi:hypothetical protein
MKWGRRHRIEFAVLMLVVVVYFTYEVVRPRSLATTKTDFAVLSAQRILDACEAYSDCPANPEPGRYPTDLHHLARPPFGGSSFLRNGEADLIDPWGNLFQHEVVKNESGETEIRVWTTRTVGNEQKVIGAKRLAKGKVETFGVHR